MRTTLIPMVAISALALALITWPATSGAETNANAPRHTVAVEGTKGVKLRMLLVTKASTGAAPKRESKIVTVPFQRTFNAQSFYVWFDTLQGGASGNNGDRVMGTWKINGELQGGGFGGTIKKGNNQSFGFGNL